MLPFGVETGADEVRNSTARHWVVTTFALAAVHSVQFLALLVLARVLVPADFGLIAMVMSVIGVGQIFHDLGLSAATIRQPDITHGQISTLFWVNLLFGLLVTALASACAPLLALAYSDPRTVQVTLALAWTFFIYGAGTQHLALLSRHLKFKRLAVINVVAMVAGQGSAVALALTGAGYWSLVVGALVVALVKTGMAWILCAWLPGLPHWNKQVRGMLSFGGFLVVFTLMGYFARNLPNVLIGSLWGATSVGFYSRAMAMLALFLGYVTGPLNIVAPAGLSRLLDDASAYRRHYLDTTNMMLLLSAPISLLCVIAAPDIIMIVLGSQWSETAVLLRIIAIAVIPQTLCATSGWLYMSHGDSRRMMIWGVGGWGVLAALLSVASFYGVREAAWAYVAGMFLLLYPCMYLAYAVTEIRMRDLFDISWPVITPALLAAIPAAGVEWQMSGSVPALRLAAVFLVYVFVYCVVLLRVFHQGAILSRFLDQLRRRKPV